MSLIMKAIASFGMKSFIAVSIFIVNTKLFWTLIKYINKIGKKPLIKSIFVTYPAEKKYADYYCFTWMREMFQWKIGIIGFHYQNGYFGLNFATPTYEEKLTSPNNKEAFASMIYKIVELKEYAGIEYVNYGGVIPSYLQKRELPTHQSANNDLIAQVIVQAVRKMLKDEEVAVNECFFFILGGKGFIGTKVSQIIKDFKYPHMIIDKDDEYDFKSTDKKYNVIINVSRKGVFELYKDQMDENTLMLNEVFPPPRIKDSEIKTAYHLKGIKATVFPSMPYDYSNVMPCCSLVSEKEEDQFDVVIKPIKR